jgi:toxin CcdB
MAQFDIHRNKGKGRVAVPYLMLLQSARFDNAPHRIVAPLLLGDLFRVEHPDLHPSFMIEGRNVVMDPLRLFSVPHSGLGELVDKLSEYDDGTRVMNAVDIVLSRAFG